VIVALLEAHEASRSHGSGRRAEDRARIGHELEHEATDHRIERRPARIEHSIELAQIPFEERDVVQARCGGPAASGLDRDRGPFDPDDGAGGPDDPRREHRDVSRPRAQFEHAHPLPETPVAEQAVGERIHDRGLLLEAALLVGPRPIEDVAPYAARSAVTHAAA
jgi:hypothetical protein